MRQYFLVQVVSNMPLQLILHFLINEGFIIIAFIFLYFKLTF